MDITPKKCCIKFDPPTLVLFYEVKKTGKLHRRSIPIRVDDEDNTPKSILKNLLVNSHHCEYLQKFNERQLNRILKKLLAAVSEQSLTLNNNTAAQRDESLVNGIDLENENLNKLDDDVLNKVKEHMNESFESNQIKPGDAGWEYDIEVDFEKDGKVESSPWDNDDDSDMEF